MQKETKPPLNLLLKRERELRGWSQNYIAEHIQAPAASYISRWERGISAPSPYYREKLCSLFGKNAVELGLLDAEIKKEKTPASRYLSASSLAPTTSRTLWSVPHPRNPLFTGHECALASMHTILAPGRLDTASQPLALCGSVGIGKTQLAIEYAHRYRDSYSAVIWMSVHTQEAFMMHLVTTCHQLALPEVEMQDDRRLQNAMINWLHHNTGWLLILDHLEDLESLYRFLPTSGQGHLLLTTRGQATGALTQTLNLEQLSPEEGALFLLQRAKLHSNHINLEQVDALNRTDAIEIACLMDGLPLALDQAGAYIEETRCQLADYIRHYRTHQSYLLQRRGRFHTNYEESITTALIQCVEKVRERNPLAVHLLYFCAFLDQSTIPEEILIKHAPYICPFLEQLIDNPLQLDESFGDLLAHSLITREPQTKILRIHRLTQDILKSTIIQEQHHQWMQWAIKSVNRAFSEKMFRQ